MDLFSNPTLPELANCLHVSIKVDNHVPRVPLMLVNSTAVWGNVNANLPIEPKPLWQKLRRFRSWQGEDGRFQKRPLYISQFYGEVVQYVLELVVACVYQVD